MRGTNNVLDSGSCFYFPMILVFISLHEDMGTCASKHAHTCVVPYLFLDNAMQQYNTSVKRPSLPALSTGFTRTVTSTQT